MVACFRFQKELKKRKASLDEYSTTSMWKFAVPQQCSAAALG